MFVLIEFFFDVAIYKIPGGFGMRPDKGGQNGQVQVGMHGFQPIVEFARFRSEKFLGGSDVYLGQEFFKSGADVGQRGYFHIFHR